MLCCFFSDHLYTYDVVLHFRGETVSVPKSGGLPRPSVAGIIERPESSTIESECHHSGPVLYKNDVEMLPCHKSDEAVVVSPQQDDAHDSFSLKSAITTTEWNRNENEQVIGFVEESSPSHYKNNIVEMDVEKELEDQRTEENEVSVVNSGALPASSVSSNMYTYIYYDEKHYITVSKCG